MRPVSQLVPLGFSTARGSSLQSQRNTKPISVWIVVECVYVSASVPVCVCTTVYASLSLSVCVCVCVCV